MAADVLKVFATAFVVCLTLHVLFKQTIKHVIVMNKQIFVVFDVVMILVLAFLTCLIGYALFDAMPLETLQYTYTMFIGTTIILVFDNLLRGE